MALSLAKEIAVLQRLTVKQLRTRYAAIFVRLWTKSTPSPAIEVASDVFRLHDLTDSLDGCHMSAAKSVGGYGWVNKLASRGKQFTEEHIRRHGGTEGRHRASTEMGSVRNGFRMSTMDVPFYRTYFRM